MSWIFFLISNWDCVTALHIRVTNETTFLFKQLNKYTRFINQYARFVIKQPLVFEPESLKGSSWTKAVFTLT